MDFVDYSNKISGPPQFSVSASAGSPKTLYQASTDIIYVNVGSGWVPMAQESSASVYSGYSSLPAATQTNILSNLSTPHPAPHVNMKATKVIDTVIRGHK
jgi:hypothetical protein